MLRSLLACALAGVTALLAPPAVIRADAAPAGWQVGAEQRVYGPSAHVDSIYFTSKTPKGIRGYISNLSAYEYRQRDNGTLTDQRLILRAGRAGDNDQCGVHPAGTFWKRTKTHWIGFYHAEKADPADGRCVWSANHTRWSIRRMESFDAGRTWHKRELVLTQDDALRFHPDGSWAHRTDDAGSPRLIVHGEYLYLFYRAANRASGTSQEMSIARARITRLGKGGWWWKWHNGSFSQRGIGGQQSPLTGLPATARGISWNTHLRRYVAVRGNAQGIDMYVSTGGLFEWQHHARIVDFTGTESAWGQPCTEAGLPLAIGYAGIVGIGGSSASSGRQFWLYYMRKPAGRCFDHRYLVRRLVTLP